MEVSLFKKSYLSKLGESNTPYKIINSAAYNDKFGNVRIYSDEYKDGWLHLIYIDEKVYVLPNSLHFHAPSVKFPKSAAIIPFATLSPFNPSFLGEVKAYKKNEFATPKVTQENVNRGELMEIAHSVGELVEYKNKNYGSSALNPLLIFNGKSKVGARIDDKIARIKNSSTLRKNDVSDLIGYLLLVCKENNWKTFDEFKD
jgi:hypothetical protein